MKLHSILLMPLVALTLTHSVANASDGSHYRGPAHNYGRSKHDRRPEQEYDNNTGLTQYLGHKESSSESENSSADEREDYNSIEYRIFRREDLEKKDKAKEIMKTHEEKSREEARMRDERMAKEIEESAQILSAKLIKTLDNYKDPAEEKGYKMVGPLKTAGKYFLTRKILADERAIERALKMAKEQRTEAVVENIYVTNDAAAATINSAVSIGTARLNNNLGRGEWTDENKIAVLIALDALPGMGYYDSQYSIRDDDNQHRKTVKDRVNIEREETVGKSSPLVGVIDEEKQGSEALLEKSINNYLAYTTGYYKSWYTNKYNEHLKFYHKEVAEKVGEATQYGRIISAVNRVANNLYDNIYINSISNDLEMNIGLRRTKDIAEAKEEIHNIVMSMDMTDEKRKNAVLILAGVEMAFDTIRSIEIPDRKQASKMIHDKLLAMATAAKSGLRRQKIELDKLPRND